MLTAQHGRRVLLVGNYYFPPPFAASFPISLDALAVGGGRPLPVVVVVVKGQCLAIKGPPILPPGVNLIRYFKAF